MKVLSEMGGRQGEKITLTINFELQKFVEKLLEWKKGTIVVMNPKNGEILALASSPSFNPNDFSRKVRKDIWEKYILSPEKPLLNRAIAGIYAPGSVFKIFVAIAGLEEKVVSPNEKKFCPGKFKLGKKEIRCWKRSGHGYINLYEAIAHSCDVYFYKLGLELGPEKIYKWAQKFRYGQKTGIDLPEEKSGILPSPK